MEPLILFGPSLILSVVIVLALWEERRPPRPRRLMRSRSPVTGHRATVARRGQAEGAGNRMEIVRPARGLIH